MQRLHEVPAPESVPPVTPEPHPGDDRRAPPSDGGHEKPPVKLPGQPGAPEQV